MGDHKVDKLIIVADCHGVKEEYNHGHCSYCPDYDGVDYRVKDFLKEWWDRAMASYEAEIWEYEKVERERKKEEQDRKEYERLKAKYEPNQPSEE